MRIRIQILLLSLTFMLLIQIPSLAQDDNAVSTNHRIDFTLIYNTRWLDFDPWEQEDVPDAVQMDALKVASGYLAGIPFHYERNRDRINVYEQVEVVARELEYSGYRDPSSEYIYFDFIVWVPSDHRRTAKNSEGYQGHGVSELEDRAQARKEARREAFESSINSAIQDEYTNSNEDIPSILDGRITWYEINRDEIDPESGSYIYDITAWVSFPEEEGSE